MERIIQEVKNNPLYFYGQKVYVVKDSNFNGKRFNAKCPICNDERKITLKGMKLTCPLCCGSSSIYSNSLYLNEIIIEEYIVNKIIITGPEYKKAYRNNKDKEDYPTVSFSAFTKKGNGYNSVLTLNLSSLKERVDPTPEIFLKNNSYCNFVFTTRSRAEAAANEIIRKDMQRLLEFNKTYDTCYKYPFGLY